MARPSTVCVHPRGHILGHTRSLSHAARSPHSAAAFQSLLLGFCSSQKQHIDGRKLGEAQRQWGLPPSSAGPVPPKASRWDTCSRVWATPAAPSAGLPLSSVLLPCESQSRPGVGGRGTVRGPGSCAGRGEGSHAVRVGDQDGTSLAHCIDDSTFCVTHQFHKLLLKSHPANLPTAFLLGAAVLLKELLRPHRRTV